MTERNFDIYENLSGRASEEEKAMYDFLVAEFIHEIDDIVKQTKEQEEVLDRVIKNFITSKINGLADNSRSSIEKYATQKLFGRINADLISSIIKYHTKATKLLASSKKLILTQEKKSYSYYEAIKAKNELGEDILVCSINKLDKFIDESVNLYDIDFYGYGQFIFIRGNKCEKIKARHGAINSPEDIRNYSKGYFVELTQEEKQGYHYYHSQVKHRLVPHNLNGPCEMERLETKYGFSFAIDGKVLDKKDSARCLKYFLDGEMKTLNELMKLLQFKYQMAESRKSTKDTRSHGHRITYGIY